MQIFESNKHSISTTGDLWDVGVSFFLKMDRFEGAKPHSPLNVADWLRPKTSTTPFEVTRQGNVSDWANISEDTAAGQPGWSTEVAGT